MPDLVQISRDDAVTIVTLNLPAKKNSLTVELRLELGRVLEELQLDETCRAIVVTGAGGAFCAGGDINAMRAGDPVGSRYRLVIAQKIVRMLAAGAKPTVAAVEGPALGGGFALALACDRVLVAPDATFGASYVRLGLMPDMALLWTLPPRVGQSKAKELMLLGTVVKAEEAVALGVADRLVTEGSVLAAAVEEAKRLAAAPPLAVGLIKAAFARGPMDLEATFHLEADGQTLLYQTEDHAEGRDAFFGKRRPTFKGR